MKKFTFFDISKRFLLFLCVSTFLSGCSYVADYSYPSPGMYKEPVVNEFRYNDSGDSCHCNVDEFPISIPFGESSILLDDIILLENCSDYEYSSAIVIRGDCSSLSDSDRHWLMKEDFMLHSSAVFSSDDSRSNMSGKMFAFDDSVYFWFFLISSSRESVSECERINAFMTYDESDICYNFTFTLPPDCVKSPFDESVDENILVLWEKFR